MIMGKNKNKSSESKDGAGDNGPDSLPSSVLQHIEPSQTDSVARLRKVVRDRLGNTYAPFAPKMLETLVKAPFNVLTPKALMSIPDKAWIELGAAVGYGPTAILRPSRLAMRRSSMSESRKQTVSPVKAVKTEQEYGISPSVLVLSILLVVVSISLPLFYNGALSGIFAGEAPNAITTDSSSAQPPIVSSPTPSASKQPVNSAPKAARSRRSSDSSSNTAAKPTKSKPAKTEEEPKAYKYKSRVSDPNFARFSTKEQLDEAYHRSLRSDALEANWKDASTPLVEAIRRTTAKATDPAETKRRNSGYKKLVKDFKPQSVGCDKPGYVLSEDPRIFIFPDFATEAEMQHIEKRISEWEGETRDGFTGRSFELPTYSDTVVRDLSHRMMVAINGESNSMDTTLRIRRYYEIGQYHPAHTDWFELGPPLNSTLVATTMLYLTDTAEGGETVFPNTDPVPFSVTPRRGTVVAWWSCKDDGLEDLQSIHFSRPLIRGKKTIVNNFIYSSVDSCAVADPDLCVLPKRVSSAISALS